MSERSLRPSGSAVRLLRQLFNATPRNRSAALLIVLFAAIVAATEPVLPALMKHVLDVGFTAKRDFPLWAVPAVLMGLFTVRGLAWLASQFLTQWLTQNVLARVRELVYGQIVHAQLSQLQRESASSLIGASVYEAQLALGMIFPGLLTLVRDSFTLIALFGYLLWVNWSLTLLTLGILLPLIFTMRIISRRAKRLNAQMQKAAEETSYALEEGMLAAPVIRVHNAQSGFAARFDRINQSLRRTTVKTLVSGSTTTPVSQWLSALAVSVVIVFAMWQSDVSGQHSVGGFVAFITAMMMTLSPLRRVADIVQPMMRALTSLDRLRSIVDAPQEQDTGTHTAERVRGDLEFDDVGVTLSAMDRPVLDGIRLRVQAGESLALVGPSGAGKTTLMRLVPRLLEPTRGRLLLDGVPLRDWSLHSLREQIAYVGQDVVLLNDSIGANVSFGSEVDEDRAWAALNAAALGDFVRGLPGGLQAPVGHNGSQLSGGQRQRLSIARALYRNAPLLILDEATSALDAESERLVQQAINRLMEGRTTIVIAHRLATIAHCHRIAVLDEGRLIELGTQAELLQKDGLYAQLHRMQFRPGEAKSNAG
ncbi:ATP-binding cassette domain-containing protein [Thiomonas arsenitoxydans]|uniref:ATP-binding cassette domain-containing protein n=1 Tax=Thiomonas arsenitoxydans (strain DSM 22701 / CIP 110005 / 3As) TaxID=426114 RepID=UPI001AC74762|nr:ATP-binding cassette domain-containing protein [Thiomonas arsenitoxydans]MBN8777120.1 ATP-binding cassette domain-containing protein [Thiomonas arsenitoxydans]